MREVPRGPRASGGSLANVAVGLARLGARSAMVGVVGADEFGHFLRERLAAEGVDVSHLRQTDRGRDGPGLHLADARGERSFTYFRTRSAEFLLDERDVDPAFLARARVLHWGTNSLLLPEARGRPWSRCARLARAGADRQLRSEPAAAHVAGPRRAEGLLERLLPRCTVVKLSEEEIEFVTGTRGCPRRRWRRSAAGRARCPW